MTDRLRNHGHRPIAINLVDFLAYRLHGERHVRAGVTVGHRVHIQSVDARLMGLEKVTKRFNNLLQISCGDTLIRHCP